MRPIYPGRSFRSQLAGAADPGWRDVYLGEYGSVRAIRDRRHKLVKRYAGGANLLHDMREDPARDGQLVRRHPNARRMLRGSSGS